MNLAHSKQELFAALLTDAIHAIRILEGKPIHVIQDELGFTLGRNSGSSIIHWQRGYVPAQRADVETLARVLVRRGKRDQQWLEQFMLCANLSSEVLCSELFPTNQAIKKTWDNSRLPNRQYGQLLGREKLINKILSILRILDGQDILSITGQGGIGKTAIALEVIYRCLDEGIFDKILWLSALHRTVLSSEILGAYMTFETVLDAVGSSLAGEGFSKYKLVEKIQSVKSILANKRVLIVLDNMETSAEPQTSIINQLRPLLGSSKALLTSRHRFRSDWYEVNLTGLEELDGIDFIRQDATLKEIGHVQLASSEELQPIVRTTGGSPLAMQLVVSQLRLFSLEIILNDLKQVTPLAQVEGDGEYVHFYKFVFFRSWQMLKRNSKQLLVHMAHFDTDDGCRFEALQRMTGFSLSLLVSSIESLWDFSFLEAKSASGLQEIRYYLHPLTQYFVLADIAKVL